MALEYSRPNGDIAIGDWSPSPLHLNVNEGAPNDADFITAGGETYCELSLSTITLPLTGTVTIRVRGRKADGVADTVDLVCTLVEGATIIATRTFENITDIWTTYSFVLTTLERDAIVADNNLRLRLSRVLSTPANAVYFNGEVVMFNGEVVTYGP